MTYRWHVSPLVFAIRLGVDGYGGSLSRGKLAQVVEQPRLPGWILQEDHFHIWYFRNVPYIRVSNDDCPLLPGSKRARMAA